MGKRLVGIPYDEMPRYIEQYQEEIEKLTKKERYKYIDGTGYFDEEYVLGREREIERLNNIINELKEEYSKEIEKLLDCIEELETEIVKLQNIIDKMV